MRYCGGLFVVVGVVALAHDVLGGATASLRNILAALLLIVVSLILFWCVRD